MRLNKSCAMIFLCAALLSSGSPSEAASSKVADADQLTELGSFEGLDTRIRLSGDGTQFSGVYQDGNRHRHIFRWNKAEGLRDLEAFLDKQPQFHSITSDGTAGVGVFQYTEAGKAVTEPFRWEHTDGFHIFDKFENEPVFPRAISENGKIIFGQLGYNFTHFRLFRWTSDAGYFPISIDGTSILYSPKVSDDGRSIVAAAPAPVDQQPEGPLLSTPQIGNIYTWEASGGIKAIGHFNLNAGDDFFVISHDGSSVGEIDPNYRPGDPPQAFCKKNGKDFTYIGSVKGYYPRIEAISNDCAVIVGSTVIDATSHAFIWTEKSGLRDLGTMGGRSARASAVSSNGTVVVGIIYKADNRAHIVMGSPNAWFRSGDMGATYSATAGQAAAGVRCGTTDQTPASRYVINGNEVLDQKTRLTWARCSLEQTWVDGNGCVGPIKVYKFDQISEKIPEKWRLPTTGEIITLADMCPTSASNKQVFDNISLEIGFGVWVSDNAFGEGRPVGYSSVGGKNNVYTNMPNGASIILVKKTD